MKLLVLMGVVYLVYRIVKSWVLRNLQAPGQDGARNPRIDDVMVQDPVCGIYFPQREGVELKNGGGTIVFCSSDCRDRFLNERKGQKRS
jgi:uncharacterized protein